MINDIIKRQPCICRSFGHVKAYSTQWVNFSVTLNFLGPGRSRLLGFEKKKWYSDLDEFVSYNICLKQYRVPKAI